MRIPIVDENDDLIEYKDKKDRDPKEITRVSALWVTDKDGNILLAKRALTKKDHAGLWGPAVAGSVEEGETYESNIIKEAEEEIGLTGMSISLGPKNRNSTSHEYFGQWFTTIVDHDYPFVKENMEVAELKWFSKDELRHMFQDNPNAFLPNFEKYFSYFNI